MTTETLIKKLRSFLPLGPLAQEIMIEAAARLEELQEQNALLSAAVCSCNPIQVEKLVQERAEAFLRTLGKLEEV